MCGKYPSFSACSCKNLGSPPHVREIRILLHVGACESGITPACAGNTSSLQSFLRFPWDHPRMCGKYSRSTSSAALYLGSPPHVREIPLVALENYFSIRITPACAGNTCQSSPSLFSFKDHPRMCGKY